MEDLEARALWPHERNPTTPKPVLAPIFGAYHAARHRLDSAAREHGMDATTALVLDAIRSDARCPPSAVRRRLGFARSTMTSILDRLDREDLLIREEPSVAGPRWELVLTRSGVTKSELAQFVVESLELEIAGHTSPAERAGAIAVFEACRAIDRPERPHP